MNYTIALLALLAIAVAPLSRGEEAIPESVIFTDQTIEIPLEFITVLSVDYTLQTSATNLVDEVAEVVTTAASWQMLVEVALPRDYPYSLNGHEFNLDRFRGSRLIAISDAEVLAVFGDDLHAGLQFAASSGEYSPLGEIHDGFLALAAAALAERIETD